jgi:hypothetical protein
MVKLIDDDGDGIYVYNWPGLDAGSRIQYRYRINGLNDRKEEFFPINDYREFNVIGGTNVTSDSYDNDLLVSIKPKLSNSQIKVYPNPVDNQLHIRGEINLNSYSLTDINGSVIKSGQINQRSNVLIVNNLPPGFYHLKIQTDKGTSVKRFIKR